MSVQQNGDNHDDDGDNYFVSMTDMMVGVLFIFIIMLMTFALNFQARSDTQRGKIEATEGVARELDELQRKIEERLSEIRASNELRREMLEEMKRQLESEQLKVTITETGDGLRLTEDAILFDPEKSDLSATARRNVGKVAQVLARVLPSYSACPATGASPDCRTANQASVETVFIEGHTDETVSRSIDNWPLSAQRAAVTYRAMTDAHPDLRTLRNRQGQEILSIAGYSSTRRIDSAGTREAFAKNRRIDLRFLMDTDPTAGLRDMQIPLDAMRRTIEERLRGGS